MKGLRMADKKIPVVEYRFIKVGYELLLVLFIEINHHVPAENYIQFLWERVLEKIEIIKIRHSF